MTTTNYAYLGIRGDFVPDVLVGEIAITPSESKAKHSTDPVAKRPRCSSLRFAQTHAESANGVVNIYELAEAVVNKLEAHTRQLAECIKKHDVVATFQIVLDFPICDDVSTPVIGFSPQVVKFISDIGASIDMDTYRS